MFSNKYESLAQAPYEAKEREVLSFMRFPLGENTSVPAFQLDPRELAYCIDFKMNPGGRLQSRPVFKQYSALATSASIYDIVYANIDDTAVVLVSAGTKVYYLDGDLEPVEIAEVEGPARLLPYNNTCLVLDGCYLKYIKSLTEISMAYDDGDDDSAQVNNVHGEQDSSINYTAIDRAAAKFTSAACGTGYSLPVTRMSAIVEESGTADITFRVRKVSDDSIVAEKAYTGPVAASAGEITVNFEEADITEELQSEISYYASVEGSGFLIWFTDVDSGGTAYTYDAGTWTADTTKIPNISLWPGLPPRASFGAIHNSSPFIVDPDEPGRRKFGNQTHLDWSTTGEAGWIGFGDQSKNSYPIGAMINLYDELITIGTKEWPHIDRLTGVSPADYKVEALFQNVWATPDTVQNTANELWLSSENGTMTLAGVEQFGDLRTHPASEAIADAFENWSNDTITGFHPDDGQYWLYFPDNPGYIHICHVKQPIQDPDGKVRYPWTRYTNPIVDSLGDTVKITKMVFIDGQFLIGAEDGLIYTIREGVAKDLEIDYLRPACKSAYMETSFNTADVEQIQTLVSCRFGTAFDMKIYTNSQRRVTTEIFGIERPMADDVLISEISDIPIEDIYWYPIVEKDRPAFFDTNIHCFSIQFELIDVKVIKAPVYIDGFIVKLRKLKE